MEIRVWVDDWQMQCCGEPFAVGDEISWGLRDMDNQWLQGVLGSDLVGGVDKAEEHHGGVSDDVAATVGVVASIQAVHCRFGPLPGGAENDLLPVARSGTITVMRRADGWTINRGDLKFVGYVVQLTGVGAQSFV